MKSIEIITLIIDVYVLAKVAELVSSILFLSLGNESIIYPMYVLHQRKENVIHIYYGKLGLHKNRKYGIYLSVYV